MVANPRAGARVQAWYRAGLRGIAQYHGRIGTVAVAGRGRPRNHLIRFDDGGAAVVPAGNLRAWHGEEAGKG